MARQVKCKWCGTKVPSDEAYVAWSPSGKTKKYYCCFEHSIARAPRVVFYEELNNIFQTTNTVIYKEMDECAKVHTYEKMTAYLKDNEDYLTNVMNNREFYSDFARCKYFISIMRNSLGDYKYEPFVKEEVKKVADNFEMYEEKKVVRKKKKGMDSLLDELLGDN